MTPSKNCGAVFALPRANWKSPPCEEFVFTIGSTAPPALDEGKEYAITVDENGVAVAGKDYGGLMRGFFALIMKIEQMNNQFVIGFAEEQSKYILQNRMIHICVFPENDLYFIKKLIRLSALCQYTHIVIEFWGMLKYDCMSELAWPHAFAKEQAKELIDECRDLGTEPIPMLNQLGHASASRVRYGKHVVLDQNPKLQRLFTPDGWAWNIESEEVKRLLARVRHELYELFGEGEYMHVGCDEAYFISRNAALRQQLPTYLKELTDEVESEGRRPMLWMDMLLEKGVYQNCYTVGEKDEVEKIRNATALSTVFVDWQYDCAEIPIPTLHSLKDCKRDVIGAPWFNPKIITLISKRLPKTKCLALCSLRGIRSGKICNIFWAVPKYAALQRLFGRNTAACRKRARRFCGASALRVIRMPSAGGQKNRSIFECTNLKNEQQKKIPPEALPCGECL